jgi:ubiquinone/menaquinone biosynthesis C-methylase UbiE
MARPGFYRLLENPAVYLLAQLLLAPGAQRLQRKVFRRLYAGSRGMVLDVGCGPRLTTPAPDGILVGVDINRDYVARYTRGLVDTDPEVIRAGGTQTRFGVVCSADRLPFPDHTFDEARCRTLLHHLPPEVAAAVVREMVRCTRPGGRVHILDVVLPRIGWRRPLAWLLTKLDRGEWVRREEDLVRLVRAACPGSWSHFRFTLTYLGAEAVALTLHKDAAAVGREQPAAA